MKKVLILSFFFPPSPFTGSHRIHSWAKYLSRFGWYPIVVTRRWDIPVNDYKDMSADTPPEIIHQKFENFEVFYLPYKGTLRDRLYALYGDQRMVVLRKILSFFEQIIQNYALWVVPFKNLYKYSGKLLESDKEIKCIITSGRPYVLFHFCHKLKKKYNIPWIADYRDDWNTSQWLRNIPFKDKVIMKFESRSEKKWLSNAACFTTISPAFVSLISGFVKKNGYVVMNGFDPEDYKDIVPAENSNVFTILFNGSLYDTQPVEIFISAFREFVQSPDKKGKIKLVFLGLNFEKIQSARVRKLLEGLESFYEITDRFEKRKALEIMSSSQLFLMFSHTNIKGVTSSKIFDYLALGKPILLCPSDNEILEEIVISTNSGFVCNNADEILKVLNQLYDRYILTSDTSCTRENNTVDFYSRINQTKKMAEIINNATSEID